MTHISDRIHEMNVEVLLDALSLMIICKMYLPFTPCLSQSVNGLQ